MRRINIKLRCVERRVLEFNINRSMPMHRVMKAYAHYYKLDLRNIYFMTRTLRIAENDTAEFLSLNNGDAVEVRTKYYQYLFSE